MNNSRPDKAGDLQTVLTAAPLNQWQDHPDSGSGSTPPSASAQSQTEPLRARDAMRIPHISIDAFCETPDVASSMARVAVDRLMARTRVNVNTGGMAAAIKHYAQSPTPNLVLVESRSSGRSSYPSSTG